MILFFQPGNPNKLEEKDHLFTNERHIRFSDGIDNPALITDHNMVSFLFKDSLYSIYQA